MNRATFEERWRRYRIFRRGVRSLPTAVTELDGDHPTWSTVHAHAYTLPVCARVGRDSVKRDICRGMSVSLAKQAVSHPLRVLMVRGLVQANYARLRARRLP